ncbi:MAG: oligosaccharide flippase family protein [Chloroflexota bacterium]
MNFLKSSLGRVTRSRILRDSSVLFVGNWVNLLIALVTSAMLVRLLGPDGFGAVAVAMTAVNFVITFIDAQTDEALIRFMGAALARGERDSALTFFYAAISLDAVVALVALVVVILVVPPVIRAYPNGTLLEQMAWIYIITTPFNILQNNFEAIFKTFKSFRLMTIIRIATSLFSLVLLAILGSEGVVPVIWGYVIITIVTFMANVGFASWLMVKHLRGARAGGYRIVFRQLMPFVFHTSFTGSLKSIAGNIDVLLLGALASPSAVAFFKLARSAVGLIALPVAPVTTVVYPLMNEAWAVGNLARVRQLINRFMLYSAVISAGIALFFLITSDWLVNLIYGANAMPVANLIRIMSIGVVLESVMGWVRTAALADGKPQLVTFTGTAASILYIPLEVLLIYNLGAVGSAVGYVIAVLMMIGFNTFYVLPRLGLWTLFARKAHSSAGA